MCVVVCVCMCDCRLCVFVVVVVCVREREREIYGVVGGGRCECLVCVNLCVWCVCGVGWVECRVMECCTCVEWVLVCVCVWCVCVCV